MNEREFTKNTLPDLILNSPAIKSLALETNVYDALEKLKWDVRHSPYYFDSKTDKFREIDITARRLYKHSKLDHSCEIIFLVECKSIKDYHIIASNRFSDIEYVARNIPEIQLGDDSLWGYPRLKSILNKYLVPLKQIEHIIQEVDNNCHPNGFNFFNSYRLSTFSLKLFNSFRETNIGITKELEASVVWKAFQSLQACIEKFRELLWEDIDFSVNNILGKEQIEKEKSIIQYLNLKSHHVKFIHPVLVLESTLWELNNNTVKSLGYFRLVFQKLYDEEIWIDVVNKDYLEEYLLKAGEYDEFLNKRNFKKSE